MRKGLRACFHCMPIWIQNFLGGIYGNLKIKKARRAFENCPKSSIYLKKSMLRELMESGYREPGAIRYDSEGLELRAKEKIGQIKNRVPLRDCSSCLELGCHDGMVGVELARLGKTAYGLDLDRESFDPRALKEGVQFIHGDVARMPIEDRTMDLIYSFAAFEHFPDPDTALSESWRVLKKGGYLYLLFGPVYTSPYGRHAYRQIPVPYCHYLFSEEDLRAYVLEKNMEVKWPYVNGVSVTDYRALWKKYQDKFEAIYYKEHPTGGVGAELIQRFPFCFKGRVPYFEDLFVSGIELVWRKK